MKYIKILAGILFAIYLLVNSAFSGGFLDFKYGDAFSNNVSNRYVDSYFASHEITSGVIPSAFLILNGKSQIGENIPTITDNTINFTATDSYYSRMASLMLYQSGNKGQDPLNRSLTVDALLIMPKKFDSIHSEVVNFTDDGSHAEVRINFTYDNQVYEFTNQSDLSSETNTLTLILQPFCEEFEGLNLDTEETFSEFEGNNGIDYEGRFTIQAMQN